MELNVVNNNIYNIKLKEFQFSSVAYKMIFLSHLRLVTANLYWKRWM